MTKTELHQKHPAILKSESVSLLSDLSAHMRRGMPLTPPNRELDATAAARQLGIQEGWSYACEYLHNAHLPAQQAQPTPQVMRPYSQPAGPQVPAEEAPKS